MYYPSEGLSESIYPNGLSIVGETPEKRASDGADLLGSKEQTRPWIMYGSVSVK